jgi:hypothetical protein
MHNSRDIRSYKLPPKNYSTPYSRPRMNGIWANPLRGLSLKERWRVLKLARSGQRIDHAQDARLVEDVLRAELSPHETRSWRWQAAVLLLIAAVLIWWASIGLAGASAGVGPPLIAVAVAAWARSRYKATARANGWRL